MIITKVTIKQHLLRGYLTGQSRLNTVPIEDIRKVLQKHHLTIYAPFYVNGECNIPVGYPFCDINDVAMKAFYDQKKANVEEAKRLKARRKQRISLAERKEINKRLYEWKTYGYALVGK